jgi:hypothetical protein
VSQRLIAAAVLTLGLALGLAPLRPPRPLATDAPAAEFSAARALAHVTALARAPRAVGTREHGAARDELLARLRALGLEPQVQRAVAVDRGFGARWGGPRPAAVVENVLARISGSGGAGGAVLLAAHYDSVPWSPGAADDAAGVATLLETLRALLHGPPPRRDVIALFTDGEELGLLGARAFVDEHPWRRDVAVAVNLEGRGHRGPVLAFEASSGNGRLVQALRAAVPHPIANSLAYEVYRRLPNDTDFSVLRRAGIPGWGLAFIGGVTHYHTRLDAPERLDAGSVQHHGSYALGLARYFGAADGDWRAPDRVYFNTLGPHIASYPLAAAHVFSVLVALAFVTLLVLGRRAGRLRLLVVGGSAAAWLGLLLAVPLLALLAWQALRALRPELKAMVMGDPYGAGAVVVGLSLLGSSVVAAAARRLRRRVEAGELLAGALGVWLLLLGLVSATMPGATYLFTWPVAGALVGLDALLRATPAARWLVPLSALPALVLVAPTAALLFDALTVTLAAAPLLLVTLLLALLSPLCDLLPRRAVPVAALAGLLLSAGPALALRFDAARPRPDNLFYALDADTGRARWLSTDAAPDHWTRRVLGDAPGRALLTEYLPTAPQNSPLLPRELLAADAPALPLAPPLVETLGDEREGDERRLRLRLTSPRAAAVMSLHLPPDVEVLAARVAGRDAGAGRSWALRFWGLTPEGVELELRLRGAAPLRARLLDLSFGLPEGPGPRPADTMPTPFLGFLQDATVVLREVVL